MLKNRKNIIRISLVLLVTVLIFVSFSIGREIGRKEPICGVINLDQGKPKEVDFSIFWNVWRTVQEKFVDKDKLDPEEWFTEP